MSLPQISPSVQRQHSGFTTRNIGPSWPPPPTVDCDSACTVCVRYPCPTPTNPGRTCQSCSVEPGCRASCLVGNEGIKIAHELAKEPVSIAFNTFLNAKGGNCKTSEVDPCIGVVLATASAIIHATSWTDGSKSAAIGAAGYLSSWMCRTNCQAE